MKRLSYILVLGLVLVLALFGGTAAQAGPVTIVDTGPGLPDQPGMAGLGLFHWPSPDFQYLAAEFSTTSPVTVTSAEGWITSLDGGLLDVAIHSDGSGVPGGQLYSSTVSILPGLSAGWRGPTDLSWTLGAGTYWISFVPQLSESSVFGAMNGGPASPLGNEAVSNKYLPGPWFPINDLDFGVRILGDDASPVPDHGSTLLLLGMGLVGLRAWRKRR